MGAHFWTFLIGIAGLVLAGGLLAFSLSLAMQLDPPAARKCRWIALLAFVIGAGLLAHNAGYGIDLSGVKIIRPQN